MPSFGQPTAPDSSAPSPDLPGHFQPALQRYKINEQRIKLLTAINQIVQQRVELETNRVTLSNLLEELKRKLKRKIEECHVEKKEKIKALKQANQRLEKERFGIVTEIEHLKRHLEKEEAHHKQHARTAVVQAIQGVTRMAADQLYSQSLAADIPGAVSRNVARNAPSRIMIKVKVVSPLRPGVLRQADNKLTAARLMRDIAELRQRVAQVETRLANEMKVRGASPRNSTLEPVA
ncbi:hypothetical protein EVAR_16833_1 [Eumeta japonica]|uniref:Uncharacterized protein n=1 Tax=Eumeta variegata TaxID=151549 RepID=A0A4C1V1L2_EUMVA|nr:hypothetical protein EVAR_16833_1 [Eumeta japonica]